MSPSPADLLAMQAALAEARRAADMGEVPVGAVVYRVPAGEEASAPDILTRAHNLRETDQDPAAHAELIAMREAAKKLGSWRLIDCRVAVTLEPCPMCAGTMVNARLDACFWGAADPKAGCCGTLHNLLEEPRFNHRVPHLGGVMAEKSAQLLKDFFRAAREKKKTGQAP